MLFRVATNVSGQQLSNSTPQFPTRLCSSSTARVPTSGEDSATLIFSLSLILLFLPIPPELILVNSILHFADGIAVVGEDRKAVRLIELGFPTVREALLDEEGGQVIYAPSEHSCEI